MARQPPAGTIRPVERGATSSTRAVVRGGGSAHHESGLAASPSWSGASSTPSRPKPLEQGHPTRRAAQVGRVYPNHPAALRLGMRMGSDSPEQLHNSLVLHYYLIIASLLLHYYCISTALLLHYYSITTDFYYINSALLPLCI